MTSTDSAELLSRIPESLLADHDIRLVATDMDGTLLDESGQVPDAFWQLVDDLARRGIACAPASGRQYATLRKQFGSDRFSYIAENGTFVVHEAQQVSLTPLPEDISARTIELMQDRIREGANAAICVCTPETGYVDRHDEEFLAHTARYYESMEIVENVADLHRDNIVKIALFSFDEAETAIYPHLAPLYDDAQVTVSGYNWIDIMDTSANKGRGLATLCAHLGIDRSQVLAFGDYLNDRELLEQAGVAIAMSNAHPTIKGIADYVAPSCADHGVVQVLRRLVDGSPAR